MEHLLNILHIPNNNNNNTTEPVNSTSYSTKLSVFNKLFQLKQQQSSTTNSIEEKVDDGEDIVEFMIEHDLIDESLCYIRQQRPDSLQHKAAFFRLLTYLLENKIVARYADRLVSLMPTTFKMADFWNLLKQQQSSINDGRLFVNHGMNVGAMKTFVQKLL